MTTVFCLCCVLVLLICLMFLMKNYINLRNSYDALAESYKGVEELNSTLRAQRHDFLNHLQIVYGMTEIGEYDELKKYLEPMYKDMMKTGKALRTSKPALNALVRAKTGEADNHNIDMYVEVKSDLKNLAVPDWEMSKILSNLLDNAITALDSEEASNREQNKKIMLDITETKEAYQFIVSNNGPMIEKDKQEEVFKKGVTSKKEEGHGMGLYIVSGVIKKYKGEISLNSDEDETSFKVLIPKS